MGTSLACDLLSLRIGLIQCVAVAQIITARVICGFGVGLISGTVPTYMAETTIKKTERGPQVAIQCIYLINGVALAYWVRAIAPPICSEMLTDGIG